MSESNIELTLKHFIEHFDKSIEQLNSSNTALNARLDQMNTSIAELTTQTMVINQMEKRITNLEEENRLARESIMILKHDAKKKEEMTKAVVNPLIHKAIWCIIGFLAMGILGYGAKGVHIVSTMEREKLMPTVHAH